MYYPTLPILIVDDELTLMESFERALIYGGMNNVIFCQDSRNVTEILSQQNVGVILLDLLMPYLSGEELLRHISKTFPEIPVIIVTGIREVEKAVECLKLNAYDYLVKPVDEDRIIATVKRAIEFREMQTEIVSLKQSVLAETLCCPDNFAHILTQNKKMIAIFRYIEAVAKSTQPVLILGETGVGKELIAEAIHKCSGRKGNFVKISIAGVDETVFSDTLFGHKKGAFTNADKERLGLVENAAAGTLFLDEIGDLKPDSQIKLLRLIQEREYFPLGADEPKQSHARIIAATNQNLQELVQTGRFRNDLYYRLRSHQIHVPPLRDRFDDLPLLLNHFLATAAEELGTNKINLKPELITLLATHRFPGNVRELKSIVYDAVAQHKSTRMNVEIFTKYLNEKEQIKDINIQKSSQTENELFSSLEKLPTIKQANSLLISEALKRVGGKKTVAARMLGITRQTLIKYLHE